MSKEKKGERFKISRRSFLKASGVTGIAVFATSLIKPKNLFKIPKTTNPPDNEGVITEKWKNTSCLNCPARCATSVRVVNGKAVRIKGNPLSKVSEGEICPRGHIGLQVLYDPVRITSPMKRTNSEKGRDADPRWVKISWDEALNDISNRLQNLRNNGTPEQTAIFTGLNASSDEDLIKRFAAAYGTPNLVTNDSLENEAERVGRWLADGNYSHIAYDLGNTSYVLSFGGSIVESERPLARNLRMWGKMRRERPTRSKVVVVDPRYSITAAKADLWVPIKPGTDGALALALAYVILEENLYDEKFVTEYTSGFREYYNAVSKYSPETASGITGIKADTIRKIAREFAKAKPAVAWVGRGVAGWPNGAVTSYAIFCLNALVGSINVPGGVIYQVEPDYQAIPDIVEDSMAKMGRQKEHLDKRTPIYSPDQEATNMVAENIINGQPYPVSAAIGINSNFNITAPNDTTWDKALKNIPYYVHISPFVTEMALYADILLPATTFLEQWGYDHSPPGAGFAEIKIKQPVVEVESGVKNIGDIVFELSGRIGGSVASSFNGIGDNVEGFVKYRTDKIIAWSKFTDQGVWVGPEYKYGEYDRIFKTKSGKFELLSKSLEEMDKADSSIVQAGVPRYSSPKFIGNEEEYPYILNTYQPVLTIENGSQNDPWAQEIFMVMHGIGWTSRAEINEETASSLHIKDGDEVWVESQSGRIKLKARVTGWILPGVISVARGQGHYAPGKWQKDIGTNPNDIVGLDYDSISGQSALFNTRIKVYRA
jgi:thiosulfate reductase / polysulfide reductase chain A